MENRIYLEEFGVKGQAFFCGWALSFLMLHAMAGNGEGENSLRQLRKNQEISLRSLGKLFVKAENPQKKEVKFLTTKNSEICREALDSRHFFGREEAIQSITDKCKAELKAYEVPKYFRYIESLPYTPNGKYDFRLMEQMGNEFVDGLNK